MHALEEARAEPMDAWPSSHRRLLLEVGVPYRLAGLPPQPSSPRPPPITAHASQPPPHTPLNAPPPPPAMKTQISPSLRS